MNCYEPQVQLTESVRRYMTFNKLSSYHWRGGGGDINKFQAFWAYLLYLHVFLVDQLGQKVC